VLPTGAYLAGFWIGAGWFRGTPSVLLRLVGLVVIAVLLAGLIAWAAAMALATEPLGIEAVVCTAEEKSRVAQVVRDSRPPAGEPRHLRLTDADVDVLAAVALGSDSHRRKARVRFDQDQMAGEMSVALPERIAKGRYLNVETAGNVTIDEGELDIEIDRLDIGQLRLPRWLLRFISPAVRSALLDDRSVRQIVHSTRSMRAEPGVVETVFEPGEFTHRVVPAAVSLLSGQPDVSAPTAIYYRQLVEFGTRLPADQRTFGNYMVEAFRLAAQRTPSSDAKLENRAAILALATLLGHEDMEVLIGELSDPDLRAQAAALRGTVTLRDRPDWTRQFMVCAGTALVANERLSNRIGLMKEKLDAGEGGSGFSFADLLADRSGTLFALAATRDDTSARRMQSRLAGGFIVDDFFPPADGLPEGISQEALDRDYGGVGGAKYNELLAEVERRAQSVPAVQ
jgi:hypothetical protein